MLATNHTATLMIAGGLLILQAIGAFYVAYRRPTKVRGGPEWARRWGWAMLGVGLWSILLGLL